MLLVANLANTKWCKNLKNDWNPGTWVYSSESSQQEPSNEYQHNRVFKNLCIFVLWMKVALALEVLNPIVPAVSKTAWLLIICI